MRGCIFSAAACAAFGIGFNIRGKHLIVASAGAFVSEFICSLLMSEGLTETKAVFISAAAVSVLSEAAARIFYSPANMYLIISIIPLVPGGMLYRTMSAFVRGELDTGICLAVDTIGIAGAIAMGIFAVTSMFCIFSPIFAKTHGIKKEENNGKCKTEDNILR